MTNYECKKIAKMQSEFFIEALKNDEELANILFPPKMMDIKEASEFCKIPVNTLYQ